MRKKTTIAMLLAITTMMSMSLVGCGKKDNKPTSSQSDETTVVTTESDYIEDIGEDISSEVESTESTDVYANKLNLQLHECNHTSYEEYQITSLIGNIKDIKVSDEDVPVILTDKGLYVFGVSATDEGKEAKEKAHGLIKLSDDSNLEIIDVIYSAVLARNSSGEYIVFYTVGEHKNDSFMMCTYADDCVLEYNIGKYDDLDKLVYTEYCIGSGEDYLELKYLSSADGEFKLVQPDSLTKSGNYAVQKTEEYENSDPNWKYDTGHGLRTAHTHDDITEGWGTVRTNYNISSFATGRDRRVYFVSDNKIYLKYNRMSTDVVHDFPESEDGVSYLDWGNSKDVVNVANVDYVYPCTHDSSSVAFKKLDDKSNIYVINFVNATKEQSVDNIDLAAISHSTDDIKDIYVADDIIFIVFTNNDAYKFDESDRIWKAEKLDSLTDALNSNLVKLITPSEKGVLLVVDNNNLIYTID